MLIRPKLVAIFDNVSDKISLMSPVYYNIKFLEINDKTSFLFSFYLIFLAIFLNFLSNRFIRKDELLVSKSDRIR